MQHMSTTSKDIQLRYEGFLKTSCLWQGNSIYQIEQLQLENSKITSFQKNIDKVIRLGKLVERFLSHEMQHDKSITILAENIQIHQNKITLGELDCLIVQNEKPVHIEVVYKFYLYDDRVGTLELEHWIGPNRRDSLIQKLEKLQKKQFPILFREETRNYLERFELQSENILQKVYFKAQLFVPYVQKENTFSDINNNCISGFYIFQQQLNLFKNCKFFIPEKLDWLVIPNPNVSWISYEIFTDKIEIILGKKLSPLCWLKYENGTLQKFFVVWWD